MQAPWQRPSFASSERLREFTMTTNILGNHTSNPLCHLLDLAQKPTVHAAQPMSRIEVLASLGRIMCQKDPRACALPKAFDEYQRLIKNLESVGPASALAIDSDWKRIDLGVVNLAEESLLVISPMPVCSCVTCWSPN